MDKKLKGIAIILFGILIAQSPVTNSILPYAMGVIFGLYGLIITLSRKE
ncbi:hypothetical protein [uncultured Clostridium sp.]|nr:hypothetical protein [uncultured Clostridium sp.]